MLRTAVLDLAATLFPGRCPGCGARAEPVCADCAATLRAPTTTPWLPGLDGFVAAFAYEGVARELVARVKYRNARGAVPWLGRRLVAAVTAAPWADTLDLVTWAPTTTVRRRGRGFDHGRLLAVEVGRGLARPVRATLVRAPGPPQTGRPAAERRAGPPLRPRRDTPAGVSGARILVVDDVTTTGATLRAAAVALRAAGASALFGATVARTPARR